MMTKFINKRIVELTQAECDEIPSMVASDLPNTDMYDPILQFKFMGRSGGWNFVNVIHVNGEDEVEKGLNFIVNQIVIKG